MRLVWIWPKRSSPGKSEPASGQRTKWNRKGQCRGIFIDLVAVPHKYTRRRCVEPLPKGWCRTSATLTLKFLIQVSWVRVASTMLRITYLGNMSRAESQDHRMCLCIPQTPAKPASNRTVTLNCANTRSTAYTYSITTRMHANRETCYHCRIPSSQLMS